MWFDFVSLSSPPWFEVCTAGYLLNSISPACSFSIQFLYAPSLQPNGFLNLPCILSCLDIVRLWAYKTVLILSHPPYAPSPAHTRGQLCINFYQLHNWFAASSSILVRAMTEPIPQAWFPNNRKWRTTRTMRTIYHLQGQIEVTTVKKKFFWNCYLRLALRCTELKVQLLSELGNIRLGYEFGYGNSSRSSHAAEKKTLESYRQCLPDQIKFYHNFHPTSDTAPPQPFLYPTDHQLRSPSFTVSFF